MNPNSVESPAPRPQSGGLLFVVHCVVAIPLTALAAWLCSLTIANIRPFHPAYPTAMQLGAYMPLAIGRFFHQVGPVGLVVVSALLLGAAAFLWRRASQKLAAAVLAVHVLLIAAAIAAYTLAANQLAGL